MVEHVATAPEPNADAYFLVVVLAVKGKEANFLRCLWKMELKGTMGMLLIGATTVEFCIIPMYKRRINIHDLLE